MHKRIAFISSEAIQLNIYGDSLIVKFVISVVRWLSNQSSCWLANLWIDVYALVATTIGVFWCRESVHCLSGDNGLEPSNSHQTFGVRNPSDWDELLLCVLNHCKCDIKFWNQFALNTFAGSNSGNLQAAKLSVHLINPEFLCCDGWSKQT